MPNLTIEDIVYRATDAERENPPAFFSLCPFYAFLTNALHIARGQERQAIIDALPKREDGHSNDWNEGHNTAIAAVIRVLVERSYTH